MTVICITLLPIYVVVMEIKMPVARCPSFVLVINMKQNKFLHKGSSFLNLGRILQRCTNSVAPQNSLAVLIHNTFVNQVGILAFFNLFSQWGRRQMIFHWFVHSLQVADMLRLIHTTASAKYSMKNTIAYNSPLQTFMPFNCV